RIPPSPSSSFFIHQTIRLHPHLPPSPSLSSSHAWSHGRKANICSLSCFSNGPCQPPLPPSGGNSGVLFV
ncbi:hypothetical protein VIGAN_01410500, partial [Vigna angularis var. angularis]